MGYIRAKFRMLTVISKRLAAEKAFDLFCTPYMKSKIRTPAVFEQAQPIQFKLNGLKINGFRWNEHQPHKVLILHGFGSAAHKFHAYITALLEKNYQVLAFDAPAHGSSEGSRINAVIYSEMIEAIINQYGPVNGFMAHSFGGMALTLAMEKMPHNADTSIVLIAPATETSTAMESAFDLLRVKDPEVKRHFNDIIFEISGQKTEWFSIRRAMQNIKASVLWIHDEDDDVTPLADALKVKENNHTNIRFIITKGLGHKKIYRDAAIKNQVIEFL